MCVCEFMVKVLVDSFSAPVYDLSMHVRNSRLVLLINHTFRTLAFYLVTQALLWLIIL